MPILKSKTHRDASKDAVVLDLGDLGRQAAKLRAMAEAKAEGILSDARVQAQKLTAGATEAGDQRGYEQGLERGRLEGREQGKAEALSQHAEQFRQLQQRWSDAIAEQEKRFIDCEREAKAAALQLAVKLAEKVIQRSVETDDDLISRQLQEALSHVLEPARVKIQIHPDDRDTLHAAMPGLVESINHVTHADLIDNPNLTRGGCVVSAGPAVIDAQIETQLGRLASLLLGEPRPCPPTQPSTPDGDQPHPPTAEPETDPQP